jgi:hypothetical protein
MYIHGIPIETRRNPMADYRCYFLGRNNSFMAVNVLHSDTDSDAIVQASMLIAQSPQNAGFELWQRGRHVYTHVSSRICRAAHRAAAIDPPGAADSAQAAARLVSARHAAHARGMVMPLTLSEARRIRAAAAAERPATAYRRPY